MNQRLALLDVRMTMALMGLVVTALASPLATAAPAIMSPTPVYEFGEMDNSQKVSHDFVIKNVGDEPLVINDVKSTCGCTVAKLENKTIQPGQETTIGATFNLKGKQGNQRKRITVMSNDPQQPNYFLEFQGVAVATINMEPRLLNMGRIMDNEPHSQSVTIKSMKDGHSFAIEKLTVSEGADFTASVEEVTPGKEYRVVANTEPNLTAGTLNGRITIMTDDPEHRALNVAVYGHVIGDLQLRPNVVTIRGSSDSNARPATQYLQVLPGRTKEFELLDVIAPIEGMSAELIKRKDNDYHVKLSEMPVDDSLDGKQLIITTNLPHKPEIRIPFQVISPQQGAGNKRPARVPVVRPRTQGAVSSN